MGLISGIAKVVGVLVLVLVGGASYLYFTDYAVDASITQKGTENGADYVVVTPKLVKYDVRKELDSDAASFVCVGYTVTYAIQSGFTQVYDREGNLVWDSASGLNDNAVLNRIIQPC